MKKWPYAVESCNHDAIQRAIKCPNWQRFRASLKGLSTEAKLDMLDARKRRLLSAGADSELWTHATRIQTDNYINALKRGGQLDMNLNVVK